MDVKIFFNPVNDKLYQDIESAHSFFKNIYLPGPSFPNIKNADIAIIGLEEFRGAGCDNESDNGTDEIRTIEDMVDFIYIIFDMDRDWENIKEGDSGDGYVIGYVE